MKNSRRLAAVAQLSCVAAGCAQSPVTVHHIGTYMGGGRDDNRTIPLCWDHHLGPEGIDGKKMGKRKWEEKYGSEEELLEKTNLLLSMP